MTRLPVVGSYHTELAAYAGLRSGEARLEQAMNAALGLFYGSCDLVLSPSEASDESLRLLGAVPERTRGGSAALTSVASLPHAACQGSSPAS